MFVEEYLSLDEVLAWEKQLSKPDDFKRVRALALAIKGWTASQIAEALDKRVRTIQLWIQKYNDHGCDALLNGSRDLSAKRYLKTELELKFKARVLAGPTEKDGVGRFTAKDLAVILREEFDADYHYKAVYGVLKRLGLSWITGRKYNERKRKAEYDKFLEEAPFLSKNSQRKRASKE